jgi:hypothetical protein
MAEDQKKPEEIQLPHKVELTFPFEYGKDRKVSEIIFTRRLKAKDFRGISVNNITFDDMLKLISKATGEVQAVIDELDTEDMMKCTEVINSFLSAGQRTGANG